MPSIQIIDPRLGQEFTNNLVQGPPLSSLDKGFLVISITGYTSASNADLIPCLLDRWPSDRILYIADAIPTEVKAALEAHRALRSPLKYNVSEIVPFSPQAVQDVVATFTSHLSFGDWTFAAFPERNLQAVSQLRYRDDEPALNEIWRHMELFDLVLNYNLDPAVEIQVYVTQPEQFDHVAAVVRAFPFRNRVRRGCFGRLLFWRFGPKD